LVRERSHTGARSAPLHIHTIMNTKKLLLLTALCTPALLAFALPASRVRFAPTEGSSLTKTFENKGEFSLDHMSMTINGQESPAMPQMTMTLNTGQKVTVSDEYVSNREGAPKKLKRHYDELGSDVAMSMKMEVMGESHDQDKNVKAKSQLAGKTVMFTWDADSKEYKKAFDPAEDNADLLKGLKEDMDLRALLPENEVKEGDEWDINVKGLASVMGPGGNLSLVPDDKDGGMDPGMTSGMSSMSEMLGDMLEGEAKGKFTGMREVGGAKMAVIKVTVKISSSKDMTDIVGEAMKKTKMPAEMEMKFDHMDIDLKIEGEGELLWNVAAGHAHSFELSGPVHINMDMAMKISPPGQGAMSLEQRMEMSGTSNISAKFD
jgi:hypothetical protein